ncbi:MAG: UDP-N-acetylmuramoyl-L-alanine--D-glutamate ligase [Bacilli bacterium]
MFENKKVLILGFARSGYEAAKILIKKNNIVIVNDLSEKQDMDKVKELEELGVKFIFGSHPDDLLDNTFDYLIKNPGVPINHKYVLLANKLNVSVINEVEMAYNLLPKDIKLIAITGTNGKTTTTTLIYEMLIKEGLKAHLTGNIGFPLCSFLNILKPNDIIVMETSCQQLENLYNFNPDIAVMTNLFPAHIDFFGDYDKYKKVKTKIFQNHTKNHIAILNKDSLEVMDETKNIKSNCKYFSSSNKIEGCYVKDNSIYYYDEFIIKLSDIILKGTHNYENIMAAIMVVKELNVSNDSIIKVLKKFLGCEHRLEFVKTINNKSFYNDSKATNNKSTQIALLSFTTPTILIMGGLNRGQDFNELLEYMNHVKLIVCYGENKMFIKEFANKNNISIQVCDNLEEAVKLSDKLSTDGDTILLSPASASWDQYKDFEERGRAFKKFVNELGE